MRISISLGAAVLAAFCLAAIQGAFASEPPRPLSGRELQTLLLGNTLIGVDEGGPYWMYYPNLDTVWGRSADGDVDVGRWWVENDSYCRAWRRWFGGETRCWQMASAGEDRLLWYSLGGEWVGYSTLRDGNAIGDPSLEIVASSQGVDAGSGLSSTLEALVVRGVVAPVLGASESSAEWAPRAGQPGADERPTEPKPPLVPGQSASPAPAGAAPAASEVEAAPSGPAS